MLEGHTDQVTAVAHNPANILQACSASLDGCIMLWDIDGALMLRCFCLGLPIATMAIDATMPTDAFVLTADLPPSPTTPAYARGLAVPGRAYSVKLALDKVTLTRTLTRTLTLALALALTLALDLTLTPTLTLTLALTVTVTVTLKGSAKAGRARAAKAGGERQSGGSEGDEAAADAGAGADDGGPMLGSLARPWPAKVKSLFKVKPASP